MPISQDKPACFHTLFPGGAWKHIHPTLCVALCGKTLRRRSPVLRTQSVRIERSHAERGNEGQETLFQKIPREVLTSYDTRRRIRPSYDTCRKTREDCHGQVGCLARRG